MRIARIADRAVAVIGEGDALRGIDIAEHSQQRFPSSVRELLGHLPAVESWFASLDTTGLGTELDPVALQCPVDGPRQVFAIGMNYRAHVEEVSMEVPKSPAVFTKYPSALTGAVSEVSLPSESVDWEVEVVAVIGKGGRDIRRDDAFTHIAGYAVGQDISCRKLQFAAGSAPQFSLAKSYEGFAPVGPWLTTSEDVADPERLSMTCVLSEETVQDGTTAHLLFDIPTLIEHLSSVVELLPGDLVFTGTPDGVGSGRTPQRFIRPGEKLVSSVEGLGTITQTFV